MKDGPSAHEGHDIITVVISLLIRISLSNGHMLNKASTSNPMLCSKVSMLIVGDDKFAISRLRMLSFAHRIMEQ